jgi:RNA polymerase sigma-70 factor (ECF subfamily)
MSADYQAIQRVLNGETEAFRILVKRYERPLFCMLRNLYGGAGECEDMAQETFLAAFMNLAAYDPRRGAFSTWLFTIGRNKCLNALRKKRPQALEPVPEPSEPQTQESDCNRNEIFRRLDRALDALPVEQRTAFVLSEIQGLSYEEIVSIEGVKLGTVKSRISRAREKLRAVLGSLEEYL